MFLIHQAEFIAPEIKRYRILAPRIAAKRKAGQFVIVRLKEGGERIPLTIVDSNKADGTITLIVQGVGKSTREMNQLKTGDSILDLVGPLGKPSPIDFYGNVLVIGGGVGTAIAYPIAVALKAARNEVTAVIGARSEKLVILEKEMKQVAHKVYVTTDDGSYGFAGKVTDALKMLLSIGKKIDFVVAIGPVVMMRAVAETTRPYGIKTVVSLNPVMVDGTGMCGGCRAVVDDKTVFVCVDGPEFDAHLVDFETLERRNRAYRAPEKRALERFSCKTQEAIETNKNKEVTP
jgi:ferredoxin--NADP+ reductase